MKQFLELPRLLSGRAMPFRWIAGLLAPAFQPTWRGGRADIDRLSAHVLRDVGLDRREANPLMRDVWLRR